MARKQREKQPKAEGNNAKVQIIVAIIGVIGAIIVGLFSFPPFQRVFDPTPTNITTSTPAGTVTPTGLVPLTSVLTATPPSTPLPIGRTLFRDEFIDNKNKWYVKGEEAKIIAGKYTHRISCPSDYASNYCGVYVDVPYSPPKNFRMEIDTAVIESSADADVAIGFQLRRSGRDHYYLNYWLIL